MALKLKKVNSFTENESLTDESKNRSYMQTNIIFMPPND